MLIRAFQLITPPSIGATKSMAHQAKREGYIPMLKLIQELNGLGHLILIKIHRFGDQLELASKPRSKEILETVGSYHRQLLWLRTHIASRISLHKANIHQPELLKLSSI